jgi:hypothetical protein
MTKDCSVKGCEVMAWRNGMCAKHAKKAERYGDPLLVSRRANIHEKAVELARRSLKRRGFDVKKMPWSGCKYDLLVNGSVRIEVKTAEPRKSAKGSLIAWGINIHRHGVVVPDATDFYWIVLLGVPYVKRPVSRLIKAKNVGKTKTLRISVADLMSGHCAVDYDLLRG